MNSYCYEFNQAFEAVNSFILTGVVNVRLNINGHKSIVKQNDYKTYGKLKTKTDYPVMEF